MSCQVVEKSHSAYFDVVPPRFRTILFCDNRACIANVGDGHIKTSYKSIGGKYDGIRDRVARREIGLRYCETGQMVADGFTMALSGDSHRKFLDMIGMSEQGELVCWICFVFMHYRQGECWIVAYRAWGYAGLRKCRIAPCG